MVGISVWLRHRAGNGQARKCRPQGQTGRREKSCEESGNRL